MITGRLETFRAQVYATESRIDPNTLTLTVRRALSQYTRRTDSPAAMPTSQLKREEIKDAIAIPSEAIVPRNGQEQGICLPLRKG